MERFGIIDLGSNSVRLNIVQVYDNGAYNLLDQAKVMVRLSENLQTDEQLKSEPMDRTINAVKLFSKLLKAYEVKCVIAVATAAVRMAHNGEAFMARLKAETGIEFQVISGQEEAYYDYLGAVNTIQLDNYVMIDIGGGSTEIALIQNRQLMESISLPFGSVILTEAYMTGSERKQGIDKIEACVHSALKKILWLKKAGGYPVVGMGGVARTLAKIDKQKKKYPAVSLHNYQMTKKDTMQLIKRLAETQPQEIGQMPGVSKDRQDILGPGVVPLKMLMDHIKSDKFIVSGNGLRDGLFFETYFQLRGEHVIMEDVLEHSLVNVMKRYQIDNAHSHHVAMLSLKLFDEMSLFHDFTDQDRKILYVGSMLHDIGMHIEYYNHHRHGFYLTLNSRVYGLNNEETIMAAFVVGMHRESKLKEDMEPYKAVVDKSRLDRLKKLSLFLRMAEKLDRSESQVVKNLTVNAAASTVRVSIISDEDTELERLSTEQYAKEFFESYGRNLELVRSAKA